MHKKSSKPTTKIVMVGGREFFEQNFFQHIPQADYGLHNCPTTQAIDKIVKQFKETGVVKYIERPVLSSFYSFR